MYVVYTHTYTHTCMHAYLRAMHERTHAHMHTYMTTCLHACTHCCICIRMPTYTRTGEIFVTQTHINARARTHTHTHLSLCYAHTRPTPPSCLPDRTISNAALAPAAPPTVCAASNNAEHWLFWRHQCVPSTVHRRDAPWTCPAALSAGPGCEVTGVLSRLI